MLFQNIPKPFAQTAHPFPSNKALQARIKILFLTRKFCQRTKFPPPIWKKSAQSLPGCGKISPQ
jgi:hypothetical protein